MPPTVRFTREAVLNAAFQLVRRDGPSALNARAVAKELGGSTQPIFRLFSGMEELYSEVVALADQTFCSHTNEAAMNSNNPYLSICMSYLHFAREETQLFKLLFMRDRVTDGSVGREYSHAWGCPVIIASIHVDQETAWKLYERTFFYVHGVAVCIATQYIPCMPEEKMLSLVKEAVKAAAEQIGVTLTKNWD